MTCSNLLITLFLTFIPVDNKDILLKTENQDEISPNCATYALFTIAHFLDKNIDFHNITNELHSSLGDNVSLNHLSSVARRNGIPLVSRTYTNHDFPLDRPVIALLQNPIEGHYVVLRPVGTRGTMVQVVDHLHAPFVIDYTELVKLSTWSGITLVPITLWERLRPWFYGSSTLILLAYFFCYNVPLRAAIIITQVSTRFLREKQSKN